MATNFEGCWSEDGFVFYFEDGAWGLSKGGTTIYLGKEKDVIKEHPLRVGVRRS